MYINLCALVASSSFLESGPTGFWQLCIFLIVTLAVAVSYVALCLYCVGVVNNAVGRIGYMSKGAKQTAILAGLAGIFFLLAWFLYTAVNLPHNFKAALLLPVIFLAILASLVATISFSCK